MKKSGFEKTVILRENLENAEFANNRHVKPTLHSLIANHVLRISVKLKFQCVRLKKHCFALVILNRFPICIYIKDFSHDATCIIGFFCTVMLKPKK